MFRILKNLFLKIRKIWIRRSSESYLNYLRALGISIGGGTLCLNPKRIIIDYSRPALVEIGKNVFLHVDTVIMTHDYASFVFVNLYDDFLPSHGKIKIGNNVWFGQACTVLKGVTIGDNCIIGYGSVVMKDIPANSVAAGCPAKVLCTLEEYYEKRKEKYVEEALEYARAIQERFQRRPTVDDFVDDYPVFVDGRNFERYADYPYLNVFTPEQLIRWKEKHKSTYVDMESFLIAAGL